MAGVPSCIIRFICHVPTGILGSRGLGYQNDALKLDDGLFNSIPNGLQFREGLQIVGRTGLATFIWNFILFVPSVLCSETQLGFIGVVDLLLASVLIIGASKESMYLPRSYGQCANIEQWKLGEDGRNYFIELTTLDQYASSKPSDLCHELVQNWAIGIAVSILYLACGIINITIGLAGSSSTGFGDCFSLSSPMFDHSLHTTANGWHLPLSEWNYRGLTPLRYLLPVLIPLDYAMASIRFLIRFTYKLVLRVQMQTRVKQKNMAWSFWMRRNNKTDSSTLPLEVVEIIAQNLHYADLVRVGRSSKRLRGLFFGIEAGTVKDRLNHLRRRACDRRSISQCSVCNSQCCGSCWTKTMVQEPLRSQHRSSCQAYCNRCFFLDICRWHGPDALALGKHKPSCSLAVKAGHPEMESQNITMQSATVCALCMDRPSEERREMMEQPRNVGMEAASDEPLVCYYCRVALGSRGPRWWVCSLCGLECPSNHHPSWAGGLQLMISGLTL